MPAHGTPVGASGFELTGSLAVEPARVETTQPPGAPNPPSTFHSPLTLANGTG